MQRSQNCAFTLVELSIVLVILGLLIGGVLTGQSLIRAAELRSVSTQHARYVTAVQTFRDKYMGLPGDLTNATSYWGAADGSTGNTTACRTTASTTTATCNGDGSGTITTSTAPGSNETFRFWQHLANAGLIEGSYDGITHGSSVTSVTNVNAPAGRISTTLWYMLDFSISASDPLMFDGVNGNAFQFGGSQPNSTPLAAVLKPEEAYNIDTKVDDGKPATGRVSVRVQSGVTACTDAVNSAALSANYLLSSTATVCALLFRQQF